MKIEEGSCPFHEKLFLAFRLSFRRKKIKTITNSEIDERCRVIPLFWAFSAALIFTHA